MTNRTPAATLTESRPPASAARFGINLLALIAALATLVVLQRHGLDALDSGLISAVTAAVVMIAGDRILGRANPKEAAGYAGTPLRAASGRRVAKKIAGLLLTAAVIAFAYWLFPEYHGSFYDPFWYSLGIIGPGLLIAAPFYFWWMDRRLEDPHDGYWHAGHLLAGGWRSADWPVIHQHFLGWLVKAFFLPLMINYLGNEIHQTGEAWMRVHNGLGWYDFCYHTGFLIDLLFCVIGYAVTFRLLGTHIRSTEPTAFGWLVALLCYQPFYSLIGGQYLHYEDNLYWGGWLSGFPTVQTLWGVAILVLVFVYALCTVSFGLRFSNLTHRGIITSGPYRYSKHPAYLSKNLSWWLISVPFICQAGAFEALRNCCLLALLNLVYFLRARTEERHLSQDPHYVAYALWINEHGLLRGLGRKLPFLRYHLRKHS
ncbi:MAG TPA: isoprenylcysteine carboxylmethyltransferase family protein [Stenotrophobium sp.]|nr:isoprenylcysteine carboxylmethyltransferase family protein [Stenotrophobium sp.]